MITYLYLMHLGIVQRKKEDTETVSGFYFLRLLDNLMEQRSSLYKAHPDC